MPAVLLSSSMLLTAVVDAVIFCVRDSSPRSTASSTSSAVMILVMLAG